MSLKRLSVYSDKYKVVLIFDMKYKRIELTFK